MSWKNWPYWLKGGVIGEGIGIILLIIFGSELLPSLGFDTDRYLFLQIFILFMAALAFPWNLIIFIILWEYVLGQGPNYPQMIWWGNLLGVIINGFIYGAIIGWIYSKVKLKSKKK